MEIMMAGPMVRRLLDGTKTQTRRTGKRWLKVKPGDVLAMREAFALLDGDVPNAGMRYRADSQDTKLTWGWTPAVHMPLSLVRVHLHVVRVWQERADDISDADAIAEGMERVSAGDLLEMAGGSKQLVINIHDRRHRERSMSQGYRRELWDYLAQERWPAMTARERFLMVIDILGTSFLDEVTAMEFEVQHDHR